MEIWDAYFADGILAGRNISQDEPIPTKVNEPVSVVDTGSFVFVTFRGQAVS